MALVARPAFRLSLRERVIHSHPYVAKAGRENYQGGKKNPGRVFWRRVGYNRRANFTSSLAEGL